MITLKLNSRPNYTNCDIPDPTSLIVSGITTWRVGPKAASWRPPTDIFETEDKITVRIEIAGMKNGDISIIVDQNILMIRGVRKDRSEKRAFYQLEIPFGEFGTDIEIPTQIDIENISAEYHDGFLTILLSKPKTQHIHINQEE